MEGVKRWALVIANIYNVNVKQSSSSGLLSGLPRRCAARNDTKHRLSIISPIAKAVVCLMLSIVLTGFTSELSFAQTKKTHHAHHHSKVHHTVHHTHQKQHHHHAHRVSQSPVTVTKNVKMTDDGNPIKISQDESNILNTQNDKILQQKLPTPAAFQIQNDDDTNQSFGEFSENQESASPEIPTQGNTPHLTTRERLVGLVHQAIDRLHHTSYRMGGSYFDLSRGIYEEDCSGYVDQLLNRAEPEAYRTLTQWTHSNKPNSFDYYDFFRKLPNTNSWHFWQKIKDVARLKPGAILVFRYHGRSRYGSGGHVMVVMSEPVPVESRTDTFLIQVSDSANSGHSDDTRARHMSGVGIGTLLLKVNPFTREPNAYAWKLSGWLEHADVAMAEPVTPA